MVKSIFLPLFGDMKFCGVIEKGITPVTGCDRLWQALRRALQLWHAVKWAPCSCDSDRVPWYGHMKYG